MRYVMKEKLWSLRERHTITDEAGQAVMSLETKLAWGDDLRFTDPAGVEVARIERGMLSTGYKVYRDGELAAVVRRKFALFRNEFKIELTRRLEELIVEGNFTGQEYVFLRDGSPVAVVSRQWFTWADTYGIDVVDFDDPLLILACAAVIEHIQEHTD